MSEPEIARQHWSAERYAETAHFVPALGTPVLELLAPCAGEHILDLGCGDGVLTERIAAVGASVVAVDGGPDMIAAARVRGIDARVMDGQKLTLSGQFDAVFSNAALHWMRDQPAVLAGVHRALKPGGRFVAEMGGHNNAAAIIVALKCGSRAPRARRPPAQPVVLSRGQRPCRPVSSPGSTPSQRIFWARWRSPTDCRGAAKSPTCCAPS